MVLVGLQNAGRNCEVRGVLAQVGSEDLAFAREASQGRVPKFAELLRFTNLSVGAKIWGCISAISHKELLVSLPDGLRGAVPLHEVCPSH